MNNILKIWELVKIIYEFEPTFYFFLITIGYKDKFKNLFLSKINKIPLITDNNTIEDLYSEINQKYNNHIYAHKSFQKKNIICRKIIDINDYRIKLDTNYYLNWGFSHYGYIYIDLKKFTRNLKHHKGSLDDTYEITIYQNNWENKINTEIVKPYINNSNVIFNINFLNLKLFSFKYVYFDLCNQTKQYNYPYSYINLRFEIIYPGISNSYFLDNNKNILHSDDIMYDHSTKYNFKFLKHVFLNYYTYGPIDGKFKIRTIDSVSKRKKEEIRFLLPYINE